MHLPRKAKVFYYGWDYFNQNPFTIDDRIVAKLSYDNYVIAEKKGYLGSSRKSWFEVMPKMFFMAKRNGLWQMIKLNVLDLLQLQLLIMIG